MMYERGRAALDGDRDILRRRLAQITAAAFEAVIAAPVTPKKDVFGNIIPEEDEEDK
jgi:hypothetical protein